MLFRFSFVVSTPDATETLSPEAGLDGAVGWRSEHPKIETATQIVGNKKKAVQASIDFAADIFRVRQESLEATGFNLSSRNLKVNRLAHLGEVVF